MTEAALRNLEAGDVVLMAHELAHQWWGVSVGIRSWSDFWLNEGLAEYASLLFLEHASGKPQFESAIAGLQSRLTDLQANGKDHPLHFEGWKDVSDALGELQYVKGALFFHRLRTQIGDAQFWKALARYSQRNQGKLVDSRDLQTAIEGATKLDLDRLFREEVYGK
jgi:aminopeptidase N